LVLDFCAEMCGLLRHAVKAVKRTAEQSDHQQSKEPERSFLYAKATDAGSGTGRVGNYECIKTVVSSHLLSLRSLQHKLRGKLKQLKAQPPKGDWCELRVLRGFVFCPA